MLARNDLKTLQLHMKQTSPLIHKRGRGSHGLVHYQLMDGFTAIWFDDAYFFGVRGWTIRGQYGVVIYATGPAKTGNVGT